jgi:hypothetical protein
MVIGGQAVLLHGEPRITKDIDITLGVDTSRLPRILESAARLRLVPLVKDVPEFVQSTMVLPLQDPATGIRVDMVFSNSAFEQQAIRRARLVEIGGEMVAYASLEDVVIHKVVAGRPRDLEDVRSMLLKNPRFDRDYILSWLQQFQGALDEDFPRRFQQILDELK